MDDVIVELSKLLSKPNASVLELTTSLIVAGVVLILVNIFSARFIEGRRERIQQQRELERRVRPVILAAATLISRISDLLIVHQALYLEIYNEWKDKEVTTRFTSLEALQVNRLESTAYRLVNFLVLAEEFRRKTSDTPTSRFLERAEFFLQHKIPVALRGNVFGYKLIATEIQEEIAAGVLRMLGNRPALEFSIGDLCTSMRNKKFEVALFEAAIKVFLVDTKCIADDKEEFDRNSKAWTHVLSLCYLGIYLIDFFQDLGDNGQWEEQRLLFVKMICQWNAVSRRRRYVYEPGDLETDNFIDSYPGRLTSRGPLLGFVDRIPGLRRLNRGFIRFGKGWILNRRGRRFWRRHHPKTIRAWGVRIHGRDKNWNIKLSDDFQSVFQEVKSYLKDRLAMSSD